MLYNLVIVNPSTKWRWVQTGVAYESIAAVQSVFDTWLLQHPNSMFRGYYVEVRRGQ